MVRVSKLRLCTLPCFHKISARALVRATLTFIAALGYSLLECSFNNIIKILTCFVKRLCDGEPPLQSFIEFVGARHRILRHFQDFFVKGFLSVRLLINIRLWELR